VSTPPCSRRVPADPRLARPIAIDADPTVAIALQAGSDARYRSMPSWSCILPRRFWGRSLGSLFRRPPLGSVVASRTPFSAQIQDRLIKMANRRCGLQTGVKTSGGIDRSMTQYAPDDLIGAGIGIKKQLGGNMAEQVWMNTQSCVGVDGSRELGAKERLVLWAARNSGEQGRIARRC
jgi:hypothetical protein